jgi:hypothetical protein
VRLSFALLQSKWCALAAHEARTPAALRRSAAARQRNPESAAKVGQTSANAPAKWARLVSVWDLGSECPAQGRRVCVPGVNIPASANGCCPGCGTGASGSAGSAAGGSSTSGGGGSGGSAEAGSTSTGGTAGAAGCSGPGASAFACPQTHICAAGESPTKTIFVLHELRAGLEWERWFALVFLGNWLRLCAARRLSRTRAASTRRRARRRCRSSGCNTRCRCCTW